MSKLKAISKDLGHFFMYASNFVSGVAHQWKKTFGLNKHRTLDDIVKEAKETTGKDKINLIGHSLGGLKAFVYTLENPTIVENCMMLGAPLNGTRLAYLGVLFFPLGIIPKSVLQIIPDNQFLTAVQSYFKANKKEFKNINIENFVSKNDELVSLERTCIKYRDIEDENIKEYILEGEGHVSMTYHPLVQNKLKELIVDSEYPTIFLHGFAMEKTFFRKVLKKLKKTHPEIGEERYKEKRFHFSYDYTEKIKAEKILGWYEYQFNPNISGKELLS
ncbi:MAG: alpha/beta hydrolase [Nanoarchaeota archaeon]|nr:alpha/beta hydrolase [Nanoarchaeota archaeon]MBU4351586.1 alpha/beta hydrolase [Nanoarchaeota archaeon]MBU4456627.1 alpha/beta hydrolase [Nanoarchaeota archaeon]MCG2719500.1 alpha/beta hydrolase [Nanoarchaeota archaeon]